MLGYGQSVRFTPVYLPIHETHGSQDKPEDPSAYSMKNLCSDLALLLDSLQLDSVVVAGHDWGAFVAWRFALWFPQRTVALVVYVPSFPPHPSRHSTPISSLPAFRSPITPPQGNMSQSLK